jgi:cysteine desulfurase
MIGGGQERGYRSGSENMPAIVGMAKAVELMSEDMPEEVERLRGYRDRLIEGVLESVPRSHLNGHPTERLASNAHFRFEGVEGESLLLTLRDEDIQVATGSACSSKTLEPSHTLIACGLLHEEAHGSLELTVGRFNSSEDIDRALEAIPRAVKRLRDLSPLYKEDD